MNGLEPRGFVWVIANRLAVSERIGGYGFQHRRVRRTEEINWLVHHGVGGVVSLLVGNQNLAAYEAAGLKAYHVPLSSDFENVDVRNVFAALDDGLSDPSRAILIHRDTVDDAIAGILGGYLVHAGYISDPIVATSIIQEILGRPIGPEGRRWIPDSAR